MAAENRKTERRWSRYAQHHQIPQPKQITQKSMAVAEEEKSNQTCTDGNLHLNIQTVAHALVRLVGYFVVFEHGINLLDGRLDVWRQCGMESEGRVKH
jgi:hypothetical protein